MTQHHQNPTLKDVSKMLHKFGDILLQSHRLVLALLEGGANPTDIANMVREEQTVLAGYLTTLTAMIDIIRMESGDLKKGDAHDGS